MTDHAHDEPRCERCWSWDPLEDQRTEQDPPLDVLSTGTVFFDLIFTGLGRMPVPGEELYTRGMGSCPGGIANLATALARLGLRTGLVAGFGDDAYADWMWDVLSTSEHIDLSSSPRLKDFHSAITVAMTVEGDRAMVTHMHDLPEPLQPHILDAPRARAAVLDLAGETSWWPTLAARGTTLFADIGYDESGRWDTADLEPLRHCHAFTPNAVEAMGYTRTDSPARAVRALAELVPLAVVTDGVAGSYAIDQCSARSRSGRSSSACDSPRSAARWRCRSSAVRSRRPAGATSPTGGAAPARARRRATSRPSTCARTTRSSTTSCPGTPCTGCVGRRARSPSTPTLSEAQRLGANSSPVMRRYASR